MLLIILLVFIYLPLYTSPSAGQAFSLVFRIKEKQIYLEPRLSTLLRYKLQCILTSGYQLDPYEGNVVPPAPYSFYIALSMSICGLTKSFPIYNCYVLCFSWYFSGIANRIIVIKFSCMVNITMLCICDVCMCDVII